MKLKEFFESDREDVSYWLSSFQKDDDFPVLEFFQSRVIYYPGSGYDGQPVAAFNKAHASHCFIYVDSGVTSEKIKNALADTEQNFRGYRLFSFVEVSADSQLPAPGFLAVLERDNEEYDDKHGASRIAILFLNGDGFEVFESLFGQRALAREPYCIVLQDHGFGGNGSHRFGRDGNLELIAKRNKIFPPYLFVADNTEPWHDYSRCENVESVPSHFRHGGSEHKRSLFRRSFEPKTRSITSS